MGTEARKLDRLSPQNGPSLSLAHAEGRAERREHALRSLAAAAVLRYPVRRQGREGRGLGREAPRELLAVREMDVP